VLLKQKGKKEQWNYKEEQGNAAELLGSQYQFSYYDAPLHSTTQDPALIFPTV